MKKTFLALLFATVLIGTSCGGNNTQTNVTESKKEDVKFESTGIESLDKLYNSVDSEILKEIEPITMVTSIGGINDASFNQSSWDGLENLGKILDVKVGYLESNQSSDFKPNLEKQADTGSKLIWTMGFTMADETKNAAKDYPEVNFAIIDKEYDEETLKECPNLTGVMFRAQECSFEVGYAAALATKTGKVGFVGGIGGNIIDQFEYGYRSGVAYANKETGKNVQVDVQYAESFSDQAKAKAIATKMMQNDCDIVFHAAGQAGLGVIEAAKEQGKMYIGCDKDQSSIAPEYAFTSAVKRCDIALQETTLRKLNGENIGGKNLYYGAKESATGIPTENKNMDKEVYDKTMLIDEKIKNGEIEPAYNKSTYDEFLKKLKN